MVKKGDANTKYFHIMANIRKQNNHILTLRNESEVVSSQKEKLRLTFEHFQQHIGSCPPRKYHINFAELQWQPIQLHHLDLPFTEYEVEVLSKLCPKKSL
jgi:hypothetical protein